MSQFDKLYTSREKLVKTVMGLTENVNRISGEVNTKQDTLVSGESIKTVNGESLLGSGGLAISGETLVVDETPTSGSDNLVKSGGVKEELVLGSVYDVSAHNSGTTFASLSALLSSQSLSSLIPTAVRKGGMSIKFVLTSDNNYVQFRYMKSDAATAATFTNTANWQGVDETPTAGSKNLVMSGGVMGAIDGVTGYIEFPIINNSRINVSGVISSNTGDKRSDYIDVTGLSYIYVSNPNNSKLEYDVFYDSSKTFISGSRFEVPANAVLHEVAVPQTAKYCIVSVRGSSNAMPTVYKNGVITDISGLHKSLSELQTAVKYSSQSLSTEQKEQARTNIGAASSAAETSINKFVDGDNITTGSINDINTPGGYNIGANVTDTPVASHVYTLFVIPATSRFMQKYLFDGTDKKLYFGLYDKTGGSMIYNWELINKSPQQQSGTSTTDTMSQKAITDFVQKPNLPTVSSGSVDSLKLAGGGYWVTADVEGLPEAVQGSLIVNPTFNNGRWIHKKFTTQTGNIYEQIADSLHPESPFVPWSITNPREQIATFGKNIVCFGDSLFGNYDGTNPNTGGVVYFMGRYGYATTYNVAFGGTTAALRGITYWDDMAWVSLVDAIVEEDFTAQDAAIAGSTEFPAAFATHLATLKAIDWSNIDVVTFEYGGNDFYNGTPLGNKTAGKNNYTDALVYGASKLLEKYPHLKIVLISPCWRWWPDSTGYYDGDDSDSHENSINLKLTAYADAALETAKALHILGCDNYYQLGINKYNYGYYFRTGETADGAHHDIEGRKKLAHRIVAFLNANL